MVSLKIDNVSKSYGKRLVLDRLKMSIKKSEIVALVGVNGSGKSTLIEIVCGIKKQNSGTITFDDIDISDRKHVYDLKQKLGYMPQFFCLFHDLTVKENLQYLASVYGIKDANRVEEVLQMCYIKDREAMLAKNLSGGYKQLLSLAGAILHKPSLLILDEPTSAMDPLFRKQFWSIVKKCNDAGATVLVTTHYLEEIFECDTLMCLSKGKIIHKVAVKNMFEDGKFKSVNEILDYYIMKDVV